MFGGVFKSTCLLFHLVHSVALEVCDSLHVTSLCNLDLVSHPHSLKYMAVMCRHVCTVLQYHSNTSTHAVVAIFHVPFIHGVSLDPVACCFNLWLVALVQGFDQ